MLYVIVIPWVVCLYVEIIHELFFYTIYICIDLADDETFRAEVGNGGIKIHISTWGAKLQSNNITHKYILAAFPIHINAIRM